MAWIIGLVSFDELEKLREIGWEDEDPPESLSPEKCLGDDDRTRAFYVDSDVFTIMTGPDWESVKPPAKEISCDLTREQLDILREQAYEKYATDGIEVDAVLQAEDVSISEECDGQPISFWVRGWLWIESKLGDIP